MQVDVIDTEKLYAFMNRYFNGKYRRFADAIGVDASHLYRCMTTGVGGGKKLVGGLIKYCWEHDIDLSECLNT